MELTKITELTNQLGLSSRSLRYYEQVGLIKSVRSKFEKYRFYDADTIERLKQIIILRKMQIPIKDILRIYQSENMSVVVETFVSRIRAIDEEIGALSELKRIVGEFLQTMVLNGITKISALPLLYEEMDKQLGLMEERKPVTYEELTAVSKRLAKQIEPVILSLPAMRVMSSHLKANPQVSDTDGFWRWVQARGISSGQPGRHERFDFQTEAGDVMILRIKDDFINDGDYLDYTFNGGLFAAANFYLDEDLGEGLRSLVSSFDGSSYFEIDYTHDGSLRQPAMLENLISPDDRRELVSLFVPVKRRLSNPALFDKPGELAPDSISVEEIEAQNPVLWEVNVPLDRLTPMNGPHYRVLENGEVEYTGWISTRVLSTNVEVKLPFRMDIEFRIDFDGARFGYGDSEGSIRFYHGPDLSYVFGVNMGNNPDERLSEEAISFHQPVFRDRFHFPKRGKIKRDGYNRLTWIVGGKHLAVIINGEVRYCGVHFPYMGLALSDGEARPIVVGSGGQSMKYIRAIYISQLSQTPKKKLKEGELTMVNKPSNNIIPAIHRLVTDEYGENYWFNGCARYVMESLGEKDFDYPYFAGLTGDVFAQYYPFDHFRGEGVTNYKLGDGDVGFVEDIFAKCGYASTFVLSGDLRKNTEMYLQTLKAYIDKGVPVISWGHGGPPAGVFVGYEEYGKTLLYITGNNDEPERMPVDKALTFDTDIGGWIFVGEKKESRRLARIYRDILCDLPDLLTSKTDSYCFGAEAFRAWAADLENGKFDGMKPEDFDPWSMYTSYICGLATNGSCCHEFLKRARELNPDMSFLEDISRLYQKTADMWNNQNGEDLEALGGGFNATLDALQDKPRREKIAAKIRESAACVDEIIRILYENRDTISMEI